MGQKNVTLSLEELTNSFYLALEQNYDIEALDDLTEEYRTLGISETLINQAKTEASQLFYKNSF